MPHYLVSGLQIACDKFQHKNWPELCVALYYQILHRISLFKIIYYILISLFPSLNQE